MRQTGLNPLKFFAKLAALVVERQHILLLRLLPASQCLKLFPEP